MRIYIKKKIYELFSYMEQAEKQLKLYSKREPDSTVRQLLSDTQQSAISIGNIVENGEDANSRSVILLEEYCELLWLYSVADSPGIRQKLLKKLYSKRVRAENSIRHDIPEDKLEIVFLPYKADMWTSLETIWEAFRKDESCNTNVILLPYYDIGDPGHIKLCYDLDRFPSDVEVVSYLQYDLEKHHPDIIFFHNPYDDTNNLTQLPECYFSENLKKNSELLVYSPYFTVGTYAAGRQDFLFTAPGVKNADFVIAQSPSVKELFMNYGKLSEQILDFGSPKIDAVQKKAAEPPDIPSGWNEKIGSRKVFLLNTHLSYFPGSFSNQGPAGNYAVKFHEEILDAFAGRDDCVLIWRPHPLLKNMLEGRFPECLGYYSHFEKCIAEADNGIIDRLGDYSISFSCSDALITTWSSLINEYMVTGKPVLIFQRRMDAATAAAAPLNRNMNYFRFGKNGITFAQFRDYILNGEDPLYEKRISAVRQAFPNLGGNAGKQIYEYLKNYAENGGSALCRH